MQYSPHDWVMAIVNGILIFLFILWILGVFDKRDRD